MKRLILIIVALSFTFHTWADHNRTPIKVNHNKTTSMGVSNNSFYSQNMIDFQGHMYQLKMDRCNTNPSPNVYTTKQRVILSEYIIDSNKFISLYDSSLYGERYYSDHFNVVEVYTDVFFGYANHLWFLGYEDGNISMFRYNIDNKKMDIIETHFEIPIIDFHNNYFSASCVMDTSIYLFTTHFNQTNKPYFVNSIYNDSSKTIELINYYELDNINNTNITSAESFKDDDDVIKLVYTTLSNNSGSAKLFNPVTGTTATFFTKDDLNDIKIARGSIQGDKESQVFDAGKPTANNPDRWSVWFVKDRSEKHKGEKYNKRCPIGFVQFVYENESFTRLTPDECRVVLPSDDYYAKQPENAFIDVSYNYIPKDMSLVINGNESFQKQIILINSDKNNNTNISLFNSDFYMIDPNSTIAVTDFVDESYDGINVRDYWTLVGITDGAPPASINWNLWEATHTPDFEPSELELEYSTKASISITTSSENSYSHKIGGELEILPKVKITGDISTQQSLTNESVNNFTKSFTYSISQSIGLNSVSQQNAYYFYIIPTIKRYNYKMYPWWDINASYPILGVDDYMFSVTGNTLQTDNIPLSQGIHQIANPNDPDMIDWTYRGNANIENTMAYEANMYDLAPVQLSWNAYQGIAEQKLSSETVNVEEKTLSFEHDVDWSAGLKIPDIFEIDYEHTKVKKFGLTGEVESTIENSITIKYQVGNPEVGFMCDNLVLNTYLFTPQDNFDWWYYDSLPNNFEPWYIAYGISALSKYKLDLLYPASNQQFMTNQKAAFLWKEGFSNAKIFILNKSNIRPENIILKLDVGRDYQTNISELMPGKYYWAVQAIDPEGVMTWSESRPFEVIDLDFFKSVQNEKSFNSIPVNVYPNPANTETSYASFSIADPGIVHFMLFDLHGQLIWEAHKNYTTNGIFREEIPLTLLKNSGLLKIQTHHSVGLAKILKF